MDIRYCTQSNNEDKNLLFPIENKHDISNISKNSKI